MTRKLCLLVFTFLLCVGLASAQKHALPKLNLKTWRPVPQFTANSAVNRAGVGLPLFTYAVESSRDHNRYAGAIVGNSPFNHGGGTVSVHTQIVPVVIVTKRIATDISEAG